MDPNDVAGPPRGSPGRELGDAIVGITREVTGRGPVGARVILDGDAVIVLLHDVLSKGEQTLVDAGHHVEVLALRSAYQEVMRPAYVAQVERITGRRVTTFMSTNHATPDRSAEIFLLAA